MSEEEFKKLTRNEMEKFIKTNLDSSIIFMYVQNLEEELDKKDKIINEMSKYIRACDIDEDICKTDTECISDNLKCENCIIDYFTNKVDKEGR